MASRLPYRNGVGAVLFNASGLVLIAHRAGFAPDTGWQFPQGGIDEGEDPRAAIVRELAEELGTDRAAIVAEHPEWLTYDLPPEVVGRAFRGRYRGQRQKWFALAFTGQDADLRLDGHSDPEFDAWRWTPLAKTPALAVGFKRPIYETLARKFARFADPHTLAAALGPGR
jgi:putative (di)nucleoside polyphosphate hydrolase